MAFLYRIHWHTVISWLFLASMATSISNTHAATLLDDFNDEQFAMSTTQPDSGSMPISSGMLGPVTRTLSISSSGDDDSSEMFSTAGNLSINNDFGAESVASVVYQFNALDARSFANAWLIDITSIHLGAQISLIANATSEFLFQPISQSGQYMALFSAFSDPNVFGQLTRLELKVISAVNADMSMTSLSAVHNQGTVPEPGMPALLTMGLMAAVGLNHRAKTVRA